MSQFKTTAALFAAMLTAGCGPGLQAPDELSEDSDALSAELAQLDLLPEALTDGEAHEAPGRDRSNARAKDPLDVALKVILKQYGFTGRVQATLEPRLGRKLNANLANVGRLAFFDSLLALKDDNSCSGCHAPTAGWGDSQAIAIGIDNNQKVGSSRVGPRNQRRAPGIANNAFYPTLMWNSRFAAKSGDPFDNSQGFLFPSPEGSSLDAMPTLLTAQAFIPPTELPEMAGLNASTDHDVVRTDVIARLNNNAEYRKLFGRVYSIVKHGGPITYEMLAAAIAEFELSQTYANAPIDRFARGHENALTQQEKRGALLFFGKAGCVGCHAVSGEANEMFSDFAQHNIGVPPVFPSLTNVTWDGPGGNEDFGLEQVSGTAADRYKFRTSPLRNLAYSPRYFHNGAFDSLAGAIRHHLDVHDSLHKFNKLGLPSDCRNQTPVNEIVLTTLDSRMGQPVSLTNAELNALVAFVSNGLADPRASPVRLRQLIPTSLPSGRSVQTFQ